MSNDARNPQEGTSGYNDRWMQKKKTTKTVRILLQLALVALLVYLLWTVVLFPRQYKAPESNQTGEETALDAQESGGNGFIAISYCGITARDTLDSQIVTRRALEEQLAALHASGYVTITQQDILDYYQSGKPLPEKALFLILEDGILNSATLAQSAMEKYNYKATFCTFAQYMTDVNSKFATGGDLRRLSRNSFWELGTNGYRVSYINVFDRYGDYFGHLNTNEFVLVDQYLRRDYNHYLMDFLRDEDRLREESEAQMEERLEYDYGQLQEAYLTELGDVPQMYILMHSNTGAFGNDTLVSEKNRELLTDMFAMNFNRQGSCLNTLESSIYDLTRLQSQPYFSTNHLLMRIQDDTGDDVAFVTGDEKEAAKWYQDKGVAEFKENQIILTAEPYGEGRITLDSGLTADVDVSVTLEGNKVGEQSIYLRTDRELDTGVQVALEYNQLVIRDLSDGGNELFRLDLFEFDGGAVKSRQEDQYEGLEALYDAIIRFDEDPQRVEQAKEDLRELHKTYPITLEQGGEPYIPVLDISDRDSRQLRIRLNGKRISVWLDGVAVAENLPLSSDRRGNIALGAGVWITDERYSQLNIWDDVYDAVFTDLVISDGQDGNTTLYAYRMNAVQKAGRSIRDAWDSVLSFFMERF